MKNILNLFLLIGFCFSALNIQAQTEKKLEGKWESVFRKKVTPCKFDMKLAFTVDGNALVENGKIVASCEEHSLSFPKWSVVKKELEREGKTKEYNVIKLEGDYTVGMIVEEFVGDFMKVSMEVVDGDTTTMRTYIFKKVS